MRLVKFLARAGVASRRRSESIIKNGRVQVNAEIVRLPQYFVRTGDVVRVNGKRITPVTSYTYLLLDKPPGYLSTTRDTHGRKTVLDLLPELKARVYPVGRLDIDTEGLLLLTDDGELAFRLTHPRFGVTKMYHALVRGIPGPKTLARLSRGGVAIDGRPTAPAQVRLARIQDGNACLELVLREGRKRQVKLMCAAVGFPLLHLRRIRFAYLDGTGLTPGHFRFLSTAEVKKLYRLVGLTDPPSNVTSKPAY